MARMDNYISLFYVDVIIYPCFISNAGSAILVSKFFGRIPLVYI